MHVLVVGGTAHLATTIIPHLLSSPYVSHITILSRTSIRSALILSNAKITQLLHPDLSSLPADVFTQLAGVRAVIWLVGGTMARFATADAATEANVSLPLRFLEACLTHGLVPTPAGVCASDPPARKRGRGGRYTDPSTKLPFRFLYMSTYNAEQDGFASLWTAPRFRKMKGEAEKGLLSLSEEKGQGMLEVFCLRLGAVLDGGQTVANVLREGAGGYISDALVAEKVLSLCLGGRGGAKYGAAEGSGVLDLAEVMGDGWADINSVTIGG